MAAPTQQDYAAYDNYCAIVGDIMSAATTDDEQELGISLAFGIGDDLAAQGVHLDPEVAEFGPEEDWDVYD